jgi:23S rRNA G2069 N7-methylase RlmK/C1962 C5-methylase RlmI
VPLALDRYGEWLRLIPASDPLLSRTRAEKEDWIDLMARTASESLGIPIENVFIEGRPSEPRVIQVTENGLRYDVRLSGEREIGFDPALRGLRQRLKDEASGRRVLLVGPGAAAFRLAVESGGARSTTEIEDVERIHYGTYDLAAVEVPSLDDHVSLLKNLTRRLAPSGVAYLVTRAPRTKLDVEALSDWSVEDVTAETLPEEYRRKILKIWRLTSERRSRRVST